MGKEAISSKAAESKKRKAAKKELQLLMLKYSKTDQTTPPTQACAWKKSVMKEANIQALVTGHHPVWNNRWLDEPSHEHSFQLPELLEKIAILKTPWLTRVGVAFSFMRRRVQPLQLRCTWGYDYLGPNDPSRMTSEDLSVDEVMARLRRLFKHARAILTFFMTLEEKMTTEVVQQELPMIKEVNELEDDEEPPVTRTNPIGAQATQVVETTSKAGEDQAVIQQATPKKLSPTVKYLLLGGEPSLKIKRSTRYSTSVDIGGPSPKFAIDSSNHLAQDITPTPTILPPEEQPGLEKLIKRSCQKLEMIQGYEDTIMRAEALEPAEGKDRLRKHNKALKNRLEALTREKEDLQGRITDWQNSYYRVTEQHDKLSNLYKTLGHHLQKERKLRTDGDVDLVNTMTTL
uniref:Uncharacterized protein n=1 Tax=Setaria viridis TaxID=4556 RepID=A0A4U6UXE3_SETVI|nr:hypothetical protein SEVIR_4G165400v2 [Setaria viridis]